MSEPCLIEVRLKVDNLETVTEAEIELLASVLPDLIKLMQQYNEADD